MARKNKKVPINYTSRDFESIRNSLGDHAARYYPDTYQEFGEAGFGSLLLDSVAYVGDVLSLYLDYQANENYIDTALEEESIVKIGKQMGFKAPSPGLSTGLVDIYIEIPALSSGAPDTSYVPIVKRGTIFSSEDGGSFRLANDVNFDDDSVDILVSKFDETNSVATHYVLRKSGEVISGVFETDFIAVDDFIEFNSVEVGEDIENEIVDIIEVQDSEGNFYFEVENLAQDIIYKSVTNRDSSTNKEVPNILKPVSVPRRFVVERDSDGIVSLRFGAGSESSSINDKISEPSDVALKMHGRNYISDTYFDPNILAYHDKMGIGPSNTTLSVTYRFNNEDVSNASVNQITTVTSLGIEFKDESLLNDSKMEDVILSVEVDNPEPIVGDISYPTLEETRQRIKSSFASQNRAVTKEDYVYLSYAMPGQFGNVKRSSITRDPDSVKRNLNMYIISEDSDGHLAKSSSALKSNLKTWLNKHRMVNDTVDILDAKVVNLGISFVIIADDSSNKYDTLSVAMEKLISDLTGRKMEIGESFSIIDVYKSLKEVDEVVDVVSVQIKNMFGDLYSGISFDIKENLSSDGRVLICPNNVVFEFKFPESDIKGTIK